MRDHSTARHHKARPYHWLLAVVAFAPVPWLLLRRWPAAFVRASVLTIVLGVALGQGLEPLSEVIFYQVGVEPFTNPVRWRVFAEFLAAGILVSVGSAVAARAHVVPRLTRPFR